MARTDFRARRFIVSSALAVAGVSAGPSLADAAGTSDGCAAQPLSQPLTPFGDTNNYFLAPAGDFTTSDGWTLGAGATHVFTAQADGSTGGVLDMPSGATAVSPVICITSDYPTARLRVRNLVGSEGVSFAISYLRGGAWSAPKETGQFHGDKNVWGLSKPMNLQPSKTTGWQQIRLTFIAKGKNSRFQVDDVWIDPRASR